MPRENHISHTELELELMLQADWEALFIMSTILVLGGKQQHFDIIIVVAINWE